MADFVHLHVHSEYSLLDGANKIKELPSRIKELGMNSVAITDHGVMFGAIEFYKECKKQNIKPIIGCEVYIVNDRKCKELVPGNSYSHLILLAKNNKGYENLTKIVSIGFIEGFYYKPRIDKEILEKYSEGLIVLSACLAGEVSKAILEDNMEKAKEIAFWYKNLFKDDYYIEIQNNGLKEQVLANQKLVQIARELNIPLVGTNDAHYLKKEDAYNHEVLLCIQTGKRITDIDRMKFNSDEFYIKSAEEMEEYFKNIPEAIDNTVKIAEKCNVEFEFGVTKLPKYIPPDEYSSNNEYFKDLCYKGMKKRYGENIDKHIMDRLEFEINIIEKMGYVEYFLIVWDFINYAKKNKIPVGPGRGSGAGSIAAYAIEITDIDPIKYNLLFERFLNPERISMPDFDIDFCYERRGEVIEYVARKYGQDHVSQIITFGTMSARMVIRDVGRALDVPYAEVDKLAKMIPNELHITINKALVQNKELSDLYNSNSDIKKLLDISISLEGLPRHASTHAAGVVITNNAVDSYVPLYMNNGVVSTQYTMTILEELGLLKMDFLGLRTLTVIEDAKKMVKENKNIDVVFDNNMNDENVYKLWGSGRTIGVFQFESAGMTNFMKELKPDGLEDIIAGVSLYRPGPMDQISRYIKNKLNPEHIEYTHIALEPILNVTYGCMVYQEQVMQIVRNLAGYSLGRADLVRRAMGKKKLDVMEKEREYFVNGQIDEKGNTIIKGCVKNGIDAESANKIFDEMAEFAKYAFNKSHAACYAVVAYQTAYLKTYYKAEFMAATLNSFLGNLDKIPIYIDECKKLDIEVLKPDINKSFTKFTVNEEKIRFGMGSIKNVGENAVNIIVKNRIENGEYKSFIDFCERIKEESVNKKCIESLIKAGVFDELKQNRKTLLESFEGIIDLINNEDRKNLKGQVSFFELADNIEEVKYNLKEMEEFSKKELLVMEKEMLGLYISGHPLEHIREKILEIGNITTKDIMEEKENIDLGISKITDGQKVTYIGVISKINKKYTKRNTIMAFITVEDLYGNLEVVVFDNCYQKNANIIVEDEIVIIEGKISIREENDITIVANNIKLMKMQEYETIQIDITNMNNDKKEFLRQTIKKYNNNPNIKIQVLDNGTIKPCGEINLSDNILELIKKEIGEQRIKMLK